ncbi:crosslink repair DNA glycosylase YcaQ family protein [Streptomyces sp. NPDC002793]|uniref:winged helix-turn-helix domain-containing protein n=1 Tax=Streptomyces sp. NPDC002793 TaxID=3154432 RepID=UPI003316C867
MTLAPAPAITLSLPEARRLAVAASGIHPTLPQPTIEGVLTRLRIIQLDSINVLARAHQLTFTSRLPHTTTATVDADLQIAPPPAAFEYPAHAHALVPLNDWPLWAFRRRATRRRPEYPPPTERDRILNLLREQGPLTQKELSPSGENTSNGWSWGPTKQAVEFMLWAGDLICVRRTHRWQRLLDLPERHLPAYLNTDAQSDDECLTTLLTHAGRALGIATTSDLADYLRIPTRAATRLLPHSSLLPATVSGWNKAAWAHPDALTDPGKPDGPAVFLGPFDNLIWHRPRTQRLFGFTHTLEAYKPAHQRVHGYYACPLLAHDQLIGRADLARTGHTLTIHRMTTEPDAPPETPHLLENAYARLITATGLITTESSAASEQGRRSTAAAAPVHYGLGPNG